MILLVVFLALLILSLIGDILVVFLALLILALIGDTFRNDDRDQGDT